MLQKKKSACRRRRWRMQTQTVTETLLCANGSASLLLLSVCLLWLPTASQRLTCSLALLKALCIRALALY